ncbi:MAG: sensor histidine kinase [Halodesulfurarchaeum sp.]
MSQSERVAGDLLASLRRGLGHILEQFGGGGRWLLVGAGVVLMTGSELYLFLHGSEAAAIKVLELSLPVTVGVGLVWYGFSVQDHEFDSWQIAVLGLAVLFGMVLFVLFGVYFRALLRLETLPAGPLSMLLNAMALGALLNLVYAIQYVRIKARADRLESRVGGLTGIIARVSHDLRNPLNVAEGYTEMLRGESSAEYLEPLADALERVESVVDELVVFAHSARRDDDTTLVSLESAAREAWKMVEMDGGTLEVEDDLTFPADPDRLQHLLENLYRNAADHAGPSPAVRVGTISGEPGFYVVDDGPGIPESKREEVFEPGYTTREAGTGLGLNIVAESSRQQGWEFSLTESEEGGARFEFTDLRD